MTTENRYVGDGTSVLYSFTFPYLETTDIYVSLDSVLTTEYTLANATTIEFNTPPASGVSIIIYRDTDVSDQQAEFFPGSTIRAQDLNASFEQLLFNAQEDGDEIGRTIDESTIRVDQLDPDKVITSSEMLNGPTSAQWDDDKLASAGASKRYFENLYQDASPDPNQSWERGKLWYKKYTTNLGKQEQALSIYDGTTWNSIVAGEVVPNPFTPQNTLYVDPQGSDGNPGRRPDEAYRTIKRAVEEANSATPGINTTIVSAVYDNVSGFITFTTNVDHQYQNGAVITVSPSTWSCDLGTKSYPEGGNKEFRISALPAPREVRIYVGPNQYEHTFVSGGSITPTATKLGDGYTIRCAPGVYAEKFPITVEAKNLSIIGSSLRNTYIHPDITGETTIGQQGGVDIYPTEVATMFELDSGSYLTGFTFAGLKSLGARGVGGDYPDTTYGLPGQQGWVATHRAGSFITKSPYIQNCTHFSDLQIDNSDFNPNFLGGEGGDVDSGPSGGGMLIDGETVDPSSPLRSFVVDSFTQIALGGPGVLIKNNGYAQLVSFFGTFCHFHAASISGGQMNLSNCTTDFGRYGLIADGKSDTPIFTGALYEDTAELTQVIKVHSFTKGTLWEPPRSLTPLDHMVVELNGTLYPILSSTLSGDYYNIEIFRPESEEQAYTNAGIDADAVEGNTCKFYLQSYISTGGHTFEYCGSGVDYRAHPDFGGTPDVTKQAIQLGGEGTGRLNEVNGGRVWLSSTDENGNFKVGDTFRVNQKTGVIQYLEEAVEARWRLREDLDLRDYKVYSTFPDVNIQLEPNGTGEILLGTDEYAEDGSRVKPAAIIAPILEKETDGRTYPVLTKVDIGYDPGEVPVSGLLGKLAFTDSAPAVSSTQNPPQSNELTFSVSGTTLTISYQPADGSAVKTTSLTLS